MRVDSGGRVEDSEGFLEDMGRVDAEFCRWSAWTVRMIDQENQSDAPSIRLGSPSKPPVPNASHQRPAESMPGPESMLPDAMFMLPMLPAPA